MKLRHQLKAARLLYKHSQEAAAQIMGVTQAAVSWWEQGQKPRAAKRKIIEGYILGVWDMVERTYRVTVLTTCRLAYEVDAADRDEARAKVFNLATRPERAEIVKAGEILYAPHFQTWEGGEDGEWVDVPVEAPRTFVPNDGQEQAELAHDAAVNERWGS